MEEVLLSKGKSRLAEMELPRLAKMKEMSFASHWDLKVLTNLFLMEWMICTGLMIFTAVITVVNNTVVVGLKKGWRIVQLFPVVATLVADKWE